GTFLAHSITAIRFPFPLNYGEGTLLNQARLLALGRNIYQPDLTDYPYTITEYPPIYVTMLALSIKHFGLSYAVGRTLSAIAALVSAASIVLILYMLTGDKVASAIGGLLFLAFPYVLCWSSLVRVDLVALCFSLAGILVVARWPRERWSPFVSAALMTGAAFTRQSYLLAGPLTVAGWLFLQNRKKAWMFALSLVAGTLIPFGGLNALTGGGFFFHTVTANVQGFSLSELIRFFTHLVGTSAPLLAIAVVELMAAVRRQRSASPLPSLFFLGGFLSALTIGKVGADINYFLELLAALSLVTGAAVARWRRSSRDSWARPILLALLALQMLWLLQFARFYTHGVELRIQMRPELEKLERLVEEEAGPILADEYMGLLVMNEREVLLRPFHFTQLARQGRWDQSRLVADMRARRFSLILVSDQPPLFREALVRSRWTQEMWAAIQEAYEPTQVLAGTTVYRPRGRGDHGAGRPFAIR
ncbi:MAG TPA: hypothetical protein EYP55_08820, partial [Anaerolineae bacterium]|nr:hypothetical protein [Anaerolineae bacterium]